uniref:RcnB family protein n=1 Tax=Erythrobacter oryzae TaxID=3019556 RepID=UPI00255256FD
GGRDGRFDRRGGGGFSDQVGDIARDARRADQRGDWRGDRDGWRGDRDGRGGWRGDRDGWRGDRRGWRRDDWRWGWNGRPGWDRRDFRRWDNRWRFDRRYDWNDFRRANRFAFRPGPYYAPFRSHRYSRLSIGFYLDSLFFQPRFFINDPWAYRLPPVYGPYQWVRYYDDVLLVDIYTGEVVDVINDFFW